MYEWIYRNTSIILYNLIVRNKYFIYNWNCINIILVLYTFQQKQTLIVIYRYVLISLEYLSTILFMVTFSMSCNGSTTYCENGYLNSGQ